MNRLLFITCVLLQVLFVSLKVIPNRFPKPCLKSDPNYSDCTLKYLQNVSPELIKGVPELNISSFSPFNIPVYVINKTINEYLSISAVLKDIKIWGYDTMEIKSFRFDPEKLEGELKAFFPVARVTMKYDAVGRLFSPASLKDSGYFKGQATNVLLSITFKFITIEKSGVRYLNLDKHHPEVVIENAEIKLTSNDKENTDVADFITNFFNEDPKRTIDAMTPVIETAGMSLLKFIADKFLRSIPLVEIIPE